MAEQNNQQKKGGQQQDANQLIQVRYDKLHELQANGKNPFEITKYDVTHHSTDIKDNFESLEGQEVTVAGRMMFKRVMGKASFCNIQDLKGRIQAYVARDEIGEESYADFKKYDVGDILGIKGKVFKTQTGEISIHAQEVTLLSKSLQILPEKYPRIDRYRCKISPEICGSYHERGCKRYFCKTFQGYQQHPSLFRWTGIHGSRDTDACIQCRWCCCKTI